MCCLKNKFRVMIISSSAAITSRPRRNFIVSGTKMSLTKEPRCLQHWVISGYYNFPRWPSKFWVNAMWLLSDAHCLLLHQFHISSPSIFDFVQESFLLSDSFMGQSTALGISVDHCHRRERLLLTMFSFSKWQTFQWNAAGDSFCCVREVTKHSWHCRDVRFTLMIDLF